MNNVTKTGVQMIVASLILGIAGNFLIRTDHPGLNIFLWVLLFSVALVYVVRKHATRLLNSQTISLYLALVFFAAMFALYDSPQLLAFDALAIFLILGALVVPALSFRLTESGVARDRHAGVAACPHHPGARQAVVQSPMGVNHGVDRCTDP